MYFYNNLTTSMEFNMRDIKKRPMENVNEPIVHYFMLLRYFRFIG